MRAIIIDDSRVMRGIIRRILIGYGFEVSEAGHGLDALEQLKGRQAPELALVDWNMPEMNGIDFVVQIREDHDFDSMAIVMVTTESEASQMTRALDSGANDYLMKPFSKEALQEKLAGLGFYEPAP